MVRGEDARAGHDSYALTVTVGEGFPDIALRRLASLTRDHGFELVAHDQHHVRLESRSVAVEAWYDPRGEVEVRASRLPSGDPDEVWTYTGMVGTASVDRLLELALDQLTANPAILSGEQAYYEQIGVENRERGKAWSAYYEGRGPQPTGKLPR